MGFKNWPQNHEVIPPTRSCMLKIYTKRNQNILIKNIKYSNLCLILSIPTVIYMYTMYMYLYIIKLNHIPQQAQIERLLLLVSP